MLKARTHRLAIKKILDDLGGTYGYPCVARQRVWQGIVAGLELIRKLMRQLGLVALCRHDER